MSIPYSLVHLTNPAIRPPELIYVAARAGYDCVSFRGIPTRMRSQAAGEKSVDQAATGKMPFDFANDRQLLRDTLNAAKETGVVINDSENARIFDGVDTADYEADIAATAELGAKHILTNVWTENKCFYTEQFVKLCDIAKRYDITVNLEFVTWSGIKNLKEAAALLKSSGCGNVGIVVDALHFYRSRVSLDELTAAPQKWFNYVHLCDCPREIPNDRESLIFTGINERLLPGEGAIDIRGIVEKIPNAVRGLEAPNAARIREVGFEKYAKQALSAAKKLLCDI